MSDRPVALITGAAGGLGRVMAADLAADGFDLALVGSNAERLNALRGNLGLEPDQAMTVAANLRDADAATAAIGAVYERFGRVDVLAHLVGGWTGGMTVARSPDEPFATMIDQHLWTTLNVTRELTPRMVEAGSGRVVAVSSPLAANPEAGMAAYAVGKAAMEALLTALAEEVNGTGVSVNVVRVRSIDTSAAAGARSEMPYATTTAEISAAIRYLISNEAGVISGQRIGLHGSLERPAS